MLAGLLDPDEAQRRKAVARWEKERLAFWDANPIKGFPPGPRDEVDPSKPQNAFEERKVRISNGLVIALQKGPARLRTSACRSIADLSPAFSNAHAALGAAIGDRTGAVRAAAIEALIHLRPFEGGKKMNAFLPQYIDRVLDADNDVRVAAIRATRSVLRDNNGELLDKARAAFVKSRVADDPRVRAEAFAAIGGIARDTPQAAELIRPGLDDTDAAVRRAAVYGYWSLLRYDQPGAERAVPRMRELLEDTTFEVRWAAARVLHAVTKSVEGLLPVCREALSEFEEHDLAEPCRLICRMGPDAVSLAPLIIAGVGKVPHARHWTTGEEPLEALYSVGAELADVRPALADRLAKADPAERWGALRAVQAIHAEPVELATLLVAYIEKEADAGLRQEARSILITRAPEDPRTLQQARLGVLNAGAPDLGAAVVTAARLGARVDGLVPKVVSVLARTTDTWERDELLGALADIGTSEAFAELIERLDSEDAAWRALAAAGSRASLQADAVLARFDKKPEEAARVLAAMATAIPKKRAAILKKLGGAFGPSAVLLARAARLTGAKPGVCVAELVEVLRAGGEELRRAAAEELAEWGPLASAALPDLRKVRDETGVFDDGGVAAAIAALRIGGEPDREKALARCLYGLRHSFPPDAQATRGLGYLGSHAAEAVPEIAEAALGWRTAYWKSHGSNDLTRAALWALGEIGAKAESALPAIRSMARNRHFTEVAIEAEKKIKASKR